MYHIDQLIEKEMGISENEKLVSLINLLFRLGNTVSNHEIALGLLEIW